MLSLLRHLGSRVQAAAIRRREHAALAALGRAQRYLECMELEDRLLLSVTPLGSEALVNTTTGGSQTTQAQTPQAVASDAAGNFVVVWTDASDGSGKGVYAQRFQADGTASGGEFLVNTTTSGDQQEASVAMDASGNFVVTWTSTGQDGGGDGVYAQRFNASGVAQGSEFRVNTTTAGDQNQSSVAMDATGNFVVAWTSNGQDGNGDGVYARRFNASGSALSGEFRVNTTTIDDENYASVAMNASGAFVVAFTIGLNTPDSGVRAVLYDSSGVAQTGEIQVNATTSGNQAYAVAAMDSAGNFVITWSSDSQDGNGWCVEVRQFDASGAAASSETQVNTTTAHDQKFSRVAYDVDGSFIVAWQSKEQDSGATWGIYVMQFSSGGVATSGEILVNETVAGEQQFSTIASLNNGDFIVAWSGKGSGDNSGVFMRLLDNGMNHAPVNTVPGAQSVNEDTTLVFSSGNGNLVSVADADAGSNDVLVTLTVGNGTLTLAGVAGLTFTTGDGTADATMVFSGTLTNINNALNGLSYAPTANFNGTDTFSITTNDQGNTGVGGALSDTKTVPINVAAVNDAPVNTVPGAQSVNEDSALVFSSGNGNAISISDVDAGGGNLQVTLSVSVGAGTLSLNGTTGLSFTVGSGTGDTSMQFTGTLANINAALDGLTYTPTANFTGAAGIGMVTNDLGNSGSGGSLSANSSVSVTVNAVNDPPVNTVPGAQSTNEDTALVFSAAGGNGISISDADAGAGQERVTLTVTNGTLTLAGIGGLTFTTGDGTADATMTFRGTLASINAALNGLTYAPTTGYSGAATLSITTNDLGNTGSGGAQSDSDSVAITVAAVNDAPVNTVPGAQTTSEDASLVFSAAGGNAISISDVDAGANPVRVTLSVGQGTLTLNGTTGLSFTTGTGVGNATMTFTGTIASINAALDGLVYAPAANFNGGDTLSITTNDLGNTGSGGAQSDSDTVAITVAAVNDAPVNTVPGAQTTSEDASLVFSAAGGNAISIADADAGANPVRVTLSVGQGTLTLNGTTGLSFTTGTGVGNATMTFTGTIANVNAALNGLVYTPSANFNGSDTLSITTNDQGNTGSGGPLADADTVAITVTAVNDAPVITVPAAQTTNEDTALVFSAAGGNAISVADPDLGAGAMQATLSVSTGTITLSGTAGLTFSAGTGAGDTTMTFTGTLANINAALNGLSYAPPANYNGGDTLSISVNDQGNTGSGGAQGNSQSVSITVSAVDDAPVNTVPGGQSTSEGTPLVFSSAGGNAISIADLDAGGNPLRVTLAVASGSLTLSGTTGLTFTVGTGAGNATMTFSGTLANINAALDGLLYAPTANFNGGDTLSITTNDLGNTGSGGPRTAVSTVNLTVTPVNNAPVVTAPAPQSTSEDTPLTFSAAGGNAITIADLDAGGSPLQVTLAVAHGSLTLNGTAGLTFTTGTGSGDASLTFSGTLANINAALNGLVYAPTGNFNGADALSIAVDDQGNSGAGGPLGDSATIGLMVAAVNDVPTLAAPATASTPEDVPLVFSSAGGNAISVGDVDAASGLLQVTLAATNGTLTLAGTTGLSFTTGTGSGDATLVFTGELTDVNAALDGLTYAPNANYNGPDAVNLTVDDLGNSGAGGPQSTSAAVAVTIAAVNDAPTVALPGTLQVSSQSSVFSQLTGSAITIADVDAGSNLVEVTLSVTNGTVALASTSGLSFTTGGTAPATMLVFTGTISAINSALDGLQLHQTFGDATVTIAVNDQGSIGGAPQTTTASVVSHLAPIFPSPPGPTVETQDGRSVSLPSAAPPPATVVYSSATGSAVAVTADGAARDRAKSTVAVASPFVEESAELRRSTLHATLGTVDFDHSATTAGAVSAGRKVARILTDVRVGVDVLVSRFEQLAKAEVSDDVLGQFSIDAAMGVGAALSVGYVIWCLRAGSVLASVMSCMPAWAGFDALPVLEFWERNRVADDADENDDVENLLAKVGIQPGRQGRQGVAT